MLPVAYTFGDGHKVKILISSSNYNRFQVNPNIPINDGEFFRRKPGDGRGYKFGGPNAPVMMPRVAIQRIAFSPEHPSSITLPVLSKMYTGVEDVATEVEPGNSMLIYPNPASDQVTIFVGNQDEQKIRIMDINGKLMFEETSFEDHINLNVSFLSAGIYIVELTNMVTGERETQKLTRI
jgi:hypothetical protein